MIRKCLNMVCGNLFEGKDGDACPRCNNKESCNGDAEVALVRKALWKGGVK
jgi:hypothetical protein